MAGTRITDTPEKTTVDGTEKIPVGGTGTKEHITPTQIRDFGFWNRTGTTISPATDGDDISTTGLGAFGNNVTITATGSNDADSIYVIPAKTGLSTGDTFPGTVTDSNIVDNSEPWGTQANMDKIKADDDSGADVPTGLNVTSDSLEATNFGFSIPSGATIIGIVMKMKRRSDSINTIEDENIQLTKDLIFGVGDDKASPFGLSWSGFGTYETITFGGTTDLWGTTWTPAEINASTFGVYITALGSDASAIGDVDFITINVHYSQPAKTYKTGSDEGSRGYEIKDGTTVRMSMDTTGDFDFQAGDITTTGTGTFEDITIPNATATINYGSGSGVSNLVFTGNTNIVASSWVSTLHSTTLSLAVISGTAVFTTSGALQFNSTASSGPSSVLFTSAIGSMEFRATTSGKEIRMNTPTLRNDGDFTMADSKEIKLGSGLDASIVWDGSDLLIQSNNVTADDEVHFTNFDKYTFDNTVKTTGLENDGITVHVPSTTQNITAGGGITPTKTLMRVQGSGGPVTVTATPSVADGSDGQEVIIQGDSDTNTLKLQDEGNLANSGLALQGGVDFTLGKGDILVLLYDLGDDKWYEKTRSDN